MSDHHAKLMRFPADDQMAEAFVVICSCATASPPFATQDEAARWATEHGASVEGVELVTEEGGVGWNCMFCGSSIEGEPLRISVHWTDDGVDGEQWYAAHRRCLRDRMSPEEHFAPQFAD